MPNHVESRLEVYEHMVEALLVLEIFLTNDSEVEDLLCGAPSCSEVPRAHLHVVGMLRFMFDINQPSLPTPFNSVLVSISALRPFQLYFIH